MSIQYYTVITWNDDLHQTQYHDVMDAIDHEDAEQVIKDLYPNETILGSACKSFPQYAGETVEKPVEN